MMKRFSPLNLVIGLLILSVGTTSVNASDLDENTRTVPLDSAGTTVILTPEQVKREKDYLMHHVGNVT